MPIRPINFFQNYAAGRQLADSEQAADRRNALADVDIERERKVNALMGDPNATPDQYARVGRSDVSNALANNEQSKQQAVERLGMLAQRSLELDPVNRRAFLTQAMQAPVLQETFKALGTGVPNPSDVDDATLEQRMRQLAQFAPQAREASGFELSPGQVRFDAQGRQVASVSPTPEKPKAQFRPMTPEEVAGSGLPPGTAAQVNDDTGQISVLSKRDATGNLSQKDATTAKLKLNTVKVARQQLANIRKRFDAIKGGATAGPFGQGRIPSEGGRAFDRSVDQMRSTLTALTRVPGVGAMSDYETRLDQAKFPTRQEYESVTEQQIEGIESMLAAIETGYSDLLSGTPIAEPAPAQPAAAQPTATATGPNGEKIGLVNGQWVPLGR